MTIAVPDPLNLEQFLKMPYIEDSPAWEFIGGGAIQKPMPGGRHSRLQSRLAGAINAVDSRYEAFPELRCTLAADHSSNAKSSSDGSVLHSAPFFSRLIYLSTLLHQIMFS
jgi:Uma2 family endonuclease